MMLVVMVMMVMGRWLWYWWIGGNDVVDNVSDDGDDVGWW